MEAAFSDDLPSLLLHRLQSRQNRIPNRKDLWFPLRFVLSFLSAPNCIMMRGITAVAFPKRTYLLPPHFTTFSSPDMPLMVRLPVWMVRVKALTIAPFPRFTFTLQQRWLARFQHVAVHDFQTHIVLFGKLDGAMNFKRFLPSSAIKPPIRQIPCRFGTSNSCLVFKPLMKS